MGFVPEITQSKTLIKCVCPVGKFITNTASGDQVCSDNKFPDVFGPTNYTDFLAAIRAKNVWASDFKLPPPAPPKPVRILYP